MKIHNFTFLIVILHFAFCVFRPTTVLAVTVNTNAAVGSPSVSSPSASPTDDKIQEIRDAVTEKVQEKIQEIKDKIEKKGYVGTLKEMTDSTLTIVTINGEKMVTLDKNVQIIGLNKKVVQVKDLEIEQKLILMGELDENNLLIAKRVVIVPKPTKEPPKRQAFLGRISEINSKNKTVTFNHLRKLSQKLTVKIDKNTKFNQGKFEDLKTDILAIVISSSINETEIPSALLINILP